MDKTENLLKELTEAHGIPGYEAEVRKVIRNHFKPIGDIEEDNMGSLICKKVGKDTSPKIMLAGHMDEVGFMVKHISSGGFIRFTTLGGWWDQVLLSQRVAIKTGKGDVIGVIGAKPPHLLSPEEKNKVVIRKNMYIDIGATSEKDVEKAGVRIGDPIVPVSEFTILANPKTYMSKAFDDRVGCGVVISALSSLKKSHPNTLYGVATVQEEVGVRGATTSVEMVDPDIAIILESDIAGDVPGIKPDESSTKFAGGPSLLLYDARMIPNLKLRDLVIDTAKRNKIPLQFTTMEGGATDGSVIHLYKTGVPTVVLGVPSRHIHSHNSIIHRDDFDYTVKLLKALIQKLDKKTVQEIKSFK
ncbi:MAG: M42 family peptidase [Thermodesulfobacteriales bacterium]|jgi:putative aminopeptidase FrvX|nr:MAG: M42 family peptidase [Thermodesulfobacteriales bacterium]